VPRVSVLIPAHDAAPFLDETLTSLVEQTYTDWEAIVVDDASNDDTLDVARRWSEREPRIRVIALAENSGPAVARHAGAAVATGELLGLLDADDRWLPKYLERQLDLFDNAVASGANVGIVACNAHVAREHGIDSATFHEQFGYAEPITYDRMLERCYIFVGALVTRRAYDEVGGFAGECWGTEDYDLWLRILERGYSVVQTREPLAVYRYQVESLSRNDLGMAEANVVVFRRALARPFATPKQRRRIRAALRHHRALYERGRLRRAWRARRVRSIIVAALRAAPAAAIAFLQAPSRWREWVGGAVRRG
jgi:glycosyltransferase involved in cell wall biosynthesis